MFLAFIYKKSCLKWVGHAQESMTNALVKKSELIQVEGTKKTKKKIEEGQNSLVKVLKNKYKRHVNPKSSIENDF